MENPNDQRSEKDMEDILSLAERTQKDIDYITRRIITVRGMMAMILLFSVIVSVVFGTLQDIPATTRIVVALGTPLTMGAYAAVGELYIVRRLVRRRAQQERALSELISLVREIAGGVSRKAGWSNLKQAEFRIRLSRFDIS